MEIGTVDTIKVSALERLPIRVRTALGAFQETLLATLPGQIRSIMLYGSYARGEATLDSDVDVMVVVTWEEERLADGLYRSMYCDPRWETVVDVAHDISLNHGIWISPLVVSEERYVVRQRWSFFKHVQREGVMLWSNLS